MDKSPTFEKRSAQSYVGQRVVMAMDDFETRLPPLFDKIAAWLRARGIKPSGPVFLRYHVIDMPKRMDVEAAIPIDTLPDTQGVLTSGTLPAGKYGVFRFTNTDGGISANARLIDWIAEQGEEMELQETEEGDAFAGRIETYFTDPEQEPDPSKWEMDVAIKVRGSK